MNNLLMNRIQLLKTKNPEEDLSHKILLRLERQIMSIEGEKDKMKISNLIKRLPIRDSRALRKYITEVEPGIDLNYNGADSWRWVR